MVSYTMKTNLKLNIKTVVGIPTSLFERKGMAGYVLRKLAKQKLRTRTSPLTVEDIHLF